MKKIAFAGMLLACFGFAQAGTAVQGFDVTSTLTSTCASTHGSTTPVLAFGALAAFGPGATNTVDITFKCTRSATPPSNVTLSNTTGVIAGMAYTLAVGSGTPTAGTSATTTTAATADQYKYTVTGVVAAGQAGDTAAPVTDSQTLTVTY